MTDSQQRHLCFNKENERIINDESSINDLPYDVLFTILSHLDVKTLGRCERGIFKFTSFTFFNIITSIYYLYFKVCKQWHQTAKMIWSTMRHVSEDPCK